MIVSLTAFKADKTRKVNLMSDNTARINQHLEELVTYYQKANVQLKRDVADLRKSNYEYQLTIQQLKEGKQ